jgi:hypothetical protein
MSVWFDKIKIQVDENFEKLHKKDFKFYQVDTFLKLAKKVDEFSSDCIDCKSLKRKIEEASENLDFYLNGEISSRRSYEKILNEISKHIRKTHKVFPKQYNLYSFSFFGIIAGLFLGWLIALLIDETYLKGGLILGFTVGLIAGRIVGKIRDRKLHQAGKILE